MGNRKILNLQRILHLEKTGTRCFTDGTSLHYQLVTLIGVKND